jgi:HD-like signal output (HDOD) protein
MLTPRATNATALRERIERLPLVDAGVFDVIALLNDPLGTYDQVVAKLTPDITARFLNLANSAYYGIEVRSITHAVKLLGYDAMRQNLITSFLIEHLTKQLDLERFDFEAFQERARVAAAVARALGGVLEYDRLGDAYTAALLHGIGALVVAVHFPDALREILAAGHADAAARQAVERRVLGASEAEIGALVLERFNIPAEICDAVRYHLCPERDPAETPHFELESLVRAAADMATRLRVPDGPAWERFQEALRQAGAEGQRAYRASLQDGLQSCGYQEAFPRLLAQVGQVVGDRLRLFCPGTVAAGAADAGGTRRAPLVEAAP